MDDASIHTEGPFDIAVIQDEFPTQFLEAAPAPALEPLPLLEKETSEWLDDQSFLYEEDLDFKEDNEAWIAPVPLSPIPSIHESQENSTVGEVDDTWSLSIEDIARPSRPEPLHSSEHVIDPAFKDPCRHPSEASTGAFNVAFLDRQPAEANESRNDPNVFISSLVQLGLGRDSTFFTFNRQGTVNWRAEDARAYGFTPGATRNLVDSLSRCGRLFRKVRKLGANTYDNSHFPPATVAFAQLSGAIFLELEARVVEQHLDEDGSQLQDVFNLSGKILVLLDAIFDRLSSLAADHKVLSFVFDTAQSFERAEFGLLPLMQVIIAHISRPWLDCVSASVGLIDRDAATDRYRARLEREMDWAGTLESEHIFDEAFPTFFGEEDRQLVMRIFQSMKVLEDQGKPIIASREPEHAGLRWLFAGSTVAEAGEERSSDTSVEVAATDHTSMPTTSGEDLRKAIKESLDALNVSSQSNAEGTFEAAAVASFRPSLVKQARLINQLSLRELFQVDCPGGTEENLNLTYHLRLLRRFLLMEDGMFVTRVSHGLFDPSLPSAERGKGDLRSGKTGLRLGNRMNWPPASSELQLALAGVLALSFSEDGQTSQSSRHGLVKQKSTTPSSPELPGNLGFALRQMTDEEMDRCMDPESLEALDCLKLTYTPPRPLDVVILPDALHKYDSIFRLLLRLQRLLFAVNHILGRYRRRRRNSSPSATEASKLQHSVFPSASRFAYAAHHFVSSFADYVMTSAIARPWQTLMTTVTALEASVTVSSADDDPVTDNDEDDEADNENDDSDVVITELHGIDYIRRLHATALDSALYGCLLHPRHATIRALLDDIFRLVLRFAALTTAGLGGPQEHARTDTDAEIALLYDRFRRLVTRFIQMCQGMVDGARGSRAGREGADEDGDGDGLAGLVARLTMNDFYVGGDTR